MSHKVDLPDGGWAEIRDPKELTGRQRALVRRFTLPVAQLREKTSAMVSGGPDATEDEKADAAVATLAALGADGMDAMDEMYAAFIVAYLASWSLEQPLPTTPDEVQDLTGTLIDALTRVCTAIGDGTVDFDPTPVADSPTEPSVA